MTDKKKTVEDYERLAARLAEDRDGAREVAARLAQEKKLLAGELKPLLERVSAQLGGSPAEPPSTKLAVAATSELVELRCKAAWYDAIVAVVEGDRIRAEDLARPVPPPAAFVIALIVKHKFNEHLEKNPTPKHARPPKAKRKPKKRARR